MRARERVEPGVAAVAVCGQRDAEARLLREPDHPGVFGLREHGVRLHVPVVLVGHPRLRAQVRRGGHRQQGRAQLVPGARTWQRRRVVQPQGVEVRRPAHRTVVDGPVVGERAGRDVDDDLTVPADDEAPTVGDHADPGSQHTPAFGEREHRGQHIRGDDREHPLLGLAREDLVRRHRRLAQRDAIEVDRHPAGAAGGEPGRGRLGQCAGQPGSAEVLDADDEAAVEQLQAELDENLLGERVADLDGRPARRPAALVEGRRRQHGHAADAVPAGLGAEQDDRVADPGRRRRLHPADRQHSHAQRVDQRIALVGRVEDDLSADRGQAETVAVAADARDHPGQHPGGVGGVGVPEAQRVEDGDRPGAHGENVADDPTDTGRRALVRLDEARMVVRLDLEGDGKPLADRDHPGVLAHADEQPVTRGRVAELAQVHLGRLVRAVLAPHHRVHGELGVGRRAPERADDTGILVVSQPELTVGLHGRARRNSVGK